VTHRNVEAFLGRLVTDPAMRKKFTEAPEAVLEEIRRQGFELTATELDALAATSAEAIREFAEALDQRIQKADK
jgi:predicted ribosomally synthesized peptide with nif11-like leader